MEPGLFQLLLVAGTLPLIQPVQRQYHLIQQAKTWAEAQDFCRLNFVDLATVENATDMAMLVKEAQKFNFTSEAWVGLYNDVDSWRCSLNETPVENFQKWDSAEPNNRLGHEECATMNQGGSWLDNACSEKRFCLCYDAGNTGASRFIYMSDTARTWQEARDYCRQQHTDLACPRDEAENSDIQSLVPNWTPWIGLYRDSWKWSDNTGTSGVKWTSNQPDNSGGHDNCAYLVNASAGGWGGWSGGLSGGTSGGTSGGSSGGWLSGIISSLSTSFGTRFGRSLGATTSPPVNDSSDGWFEDDNCLVRRAFFCHSELMLKKRQIVRLVVQSPQNMNDPAVKADILEKVQQKLKEQGMAENTTLRWRESPDSTVFYEEAINVDVENRSCEL